MAARQRKPSLSWVRAGGGSAGEKGRSRCWCSDTAVRDSALPASQQSGLRGKLLVTVHAHCCARWVWTPRLARKRRTTQHQSVSTRAMCVVLVCHITELRNTLLLYGPRSCSVVLTPTCMRKQCTLSDISVRRVHFDLKSA
jgi:hypothetical protein